MGTIAATPPAEIKQRTKFTAAVAVAGLSRWRSISKVLDALNDVEIPKPIKNNTIRGPAIWMM
jgi:hypothetical protein